MTKRSIEENCSSSKKIKIQDHVNHISEDVWSQTIFPFLDGNELFKSIRLVSFLWNNLVLATRCNIQVYFPGFTMEEVERTVVQLKEWEFSDRETYEVTSFKYSNDKEHCKRVREFIQSGEEGKFKNVTGITFKSKIHPCFFEKIFSLDWQHLKTLNLSNNTLNAEGAKFLANGNMNLTQLNLSNNSIGNEGIGYLSKSSIVKGLTLLNVLCNNIDNEGAQYLQGDNFKNLTQLNFQTLSSRGNRYLAMTAHFCGVTPFTIHPFDNTDDLKEYLFNYYIKYWNQYAGEVLGLSKNDDKQVLKEKIYPLPFERIAGLAVGEVGGMVYNECETEAVVGIVYGQEINEENLAKTNESTPFVIVEKLDGYSHECTYCIGKSKLEERLAKEEYEEDELEELEGDSKTFKQIASLLQSGIDNDDGRDIFLAFFIGEIVDGTFVELKKKQLNY
ncbi:predicted protein [Naegleria gruberi]|uniref:Predicted protein n=1 Tax=Naegleria gruberi TaxID=5762 RepID=D2VSS2_NAEGR|nr:uncharacterized protein NAEGRDRAFT_72041 [Naegleria gruberi]EFC40167.1 predicted protein [Naegleria gruberi]|eukprot:XP_002672911.1 predicted protein [Naegleria gruberi strain NEG-M]